MLLCYSALPKKTRYSILPALSLNGILHVDIVNGSFDKAKFRDFIDLLLLRMTPYNPDTHPANSVIILDNCQIHKDPETLQMILDRYVLGTSCRPKLIL
jgi:hypothetical protein